MSNQAQVIANLAVSDFAKAIESAVATGHKHSTGFGTLEYVFDDGSVLALRGGKVEFPIAEREVYRDECGDIDVRTR